MKQETLKLLMKISPQAADFVSQNPYEIIVMEPGGIALCLTAGDMGFIYCSFTQDPAPEVASSIRANTQTMLENKSLSEVCFNCYADNKSLIRMAQKLGFITDMCGHQMELATDISTHDFPPGCILHGFEDTKPLEAGALFDMAYKELNEANGWSLDAFTRGSEAFLNNLRDKAKSGEAGGLDLGGNLVGAWICQKDYISDLVIHPDYQGQGLGGAVLAHIVNQYRARGYARIRLRVAESNSAAYRFYRKHGFEQISHFWESTYPGSII